MPPITPAERQKILLQQEIAKLSGAISRHAGPSKYPASRGHPYSSRGRGSSTLRGRGRGRGGTGSHSLDLRNQNVNAALPKSSTPEVTPSSVDISVGERWLPIPAGNEEKEDGEVTPEPDTSHPTIESDHQKATWVKTNKSGNMSLMTKEKSALLGSRPKRQPLPSPQIQVLQSTQMSTGLNRVVIDGVIFQFEEGGTKLTRVGELEPDQLAKTGQSSTGTPTRKSLKYDGQTFRRTSNGNLITNKYKTSRAKLPCRYFTKTGECKRGLTCPYIHNPDHLSICPKFLRSTCPHTPSTCLLSHTPSPHNTPSCVHFQTSSTCRNGDSCLYPHVRVSPTAPVCEAFARGGWCDKTAGTCPDLHVWECGEWREKGSCSLGSKCGLQHVIRAKKGTGSEEARKQEGMGVDQEMELDSWRSVPVEGGFEDQDEFIGFAGKATILSGSEEDEEQDPSSDEEMSSDGSSDSDGLTGSDNNHDQELATATSEHSLHPRSASSPVGQSDAEEEAEVLGVVL